MPNQTSNIGFWIEYITLGADTANVGITVESVMPAAANAAHTGILAEFRHPPAAAGGFLGLIIEWTPPPAGGVIEGLVGTRLMGTSLVGAFSQRRL